MISYRLWTISRRGPRERGTYLHRDGRRYTVTREGWFLFGLLPLYVRDVNVVEHG